MYSPRLPAALRTCPGFSQFFSRGSPTPVQSSSTAFPCPALPIVPRTLTLPCSGGDGELVSSKEIAPCAFTFGKIHWSSQWVASWTGPGRGKGAVKSRTETRRPGVGMDREEKLSFSEPLCDHF